MNNQFCLDQKTNKKKNKSQVVMMFLRQSLEMVKFGTEAECAFCKDSASE